MAQWQNVQKSGDNPAELDTTSSKYYVYQRRNIQQVTLHDDLTGDYQVWQYEERKLTRGEYEKILADELTQTQLALVELYEGTMALTQA